MKDNKVKFIRKNGRVIPIKSNGKGGNKPKNRYMASNARKKSKRTSFFKKEGITSEKSKAVIRANSAFARISNNKKSFKKESFNFGAAARGGLGLGLLGMFSGKGKLGLGLGALIGGLSQKRKRVETIESRNRATALSDNYTRRRKEAIKLGANDNDFRNSKNQKKGRKLNRLMGSSV